MLYMIIEEFHSGKEKLLYKRYEEKGRQLPAGVHYINSWINEEITTCYQIMESDTEEKINEWIARWSDLADFKIVRVITSSEAKERIYAS